MPIVALTDAGDLIALCVALPLIGAGGALGAGFLAHRLPSRGRGFLAALGALGACGLVAALCLWQAHGAGRVGAALGEAWQGAFVVVDAGRLHGAWLLMLAALVAFLRARDDGVRDRRAFAGGIAWLWALGLWVVWLSNGPLRAWVCVLWALSLVPVLAGGVPSPGRGRAVFFAVGPQVGAALLWLVVETVAPGASWPRELCAACLFCALPLPGALRAWSQGSSAGALFAWCGGGVLATLLVGEGAWAPWAAVMCAATALVAGVGALMAQRAPTFVALALVAFLQTGGVCAFLGDRASALLFAAVFALGGLALCAAALHGKGAGDDIREREPAAVPAWAGWCLVGGLFGLLGGIVPGPALAVRLRAFAELWRGGAWGILCIAAMSAGTACVLVACARWTVWRDGGASAPVPRGVRWTLGACAGVLIVPVALECLFVRDRAAPPYLFALAAALGPVLAVAALARFGSGERIASLWSWASVGLEGAVEAGTSLAPLAALARAAGAVLRGIDRAALALCAGTVAVLRGAGELVRKLERGRM
jgi:hypothetical protein